MSTHGGMGLVSHKKICRIWAEEGLRVVVKRRRKRIGVSTVAGVTAEKANHVWSVAEDIGFSYSGTRLNFFKRCGQMLTNSSLKSNLTIKGVERFWSLLALRKRELRSIWLSTDGKQVASDLVTD